MLKALAALTKTRFTCLQIESGALSIEPAHDEEVHARQSILNRRSIALIRSFLWPRRIATEKNGKQCERNN